MTDGPTDRRKERVAESRARDLKRLTLDPGDYRPVSMLNVLSKILERAAHTQLREYLDKCGLLFGFRGGYSTDSCIIHLSDFIE